MRSRFPRPLGICLPGLAQRGTRHFLLNAHVAGRVLVLREIADALSENRMSKVILRLLKLIAPHEPKNTECKKGQGIRPGLSYPSR